MKKTFYTHLFMIILLISWSGPIRADINSPEKPLSEILDLIGETYQVIFTYDVGTLENIDIEFELRDGEGLESAVNRVLITTGLKYKNIKDKYYVIYKNGAEGRKKMRKLQRHLREIYKLEQSGDVRLQRSSTDNQRNISSVFNNVSNFYNNLAGKEKRITGLITDREGEPLIGAIVVIKGDDGGAVSGIDGSYSINVSDEATTLVFSYLGFTTKRVKIGGKSVINVTMIESAERLEEIIVTGFQTLNKGRTTGSFSKMKSVKLDQLISEDLTDRIEGRIPGVVVNPNGSIVIRGQSSFLTDDLRFGTNAISNPLTGTFIRLRPAYNKPLLVVDGFPIEADISSINTNDIESITVLKDAAAASIWGVRASNGVIVVTTKKAKNNNLGITFSSYAGATLKPDFDKFHMMSGSDMVDWDVNLAEIFGNTWTRLDRPIPEAAKITLDRINGDITEQTANQMLEELKNTDNRKQLEDAYFRNGLYQNYNLSLSKSSDRSNTYFSAQFVLDESELVSNKENKMILNFKQGYKPANWLDLQFGYTSSYTVAELNSRWSSSYGSTSKTPFSLKSHVRTYDKIYEQNGDFANMFNQKSQFGFNSESNQRLIGLGYQNWRYNYIEEQELSDNTSDKIPNKLTTGIKIRPWDIITFESNLIVEFGHTNIEFHNDHESAPVRYLTNTYTTHDPSTGLLTYNYPEVGGILTSYQLNYTSLHLRNQISLDQNISTKHRVAATLGAEIRDTDHSSTFDTKFGFNELTGIGLPIDEKSLFDDYRSLSYDGITRSFNPQFYSGTSFDRPRDVGYFSTFSYSFDNLYSATGSYRIDESNLFGVLPELRRNKLWSVGVAWTLSNEKFFSMKSIDMLRFRATYGFTGNVDRTGAQVLTGRPRIDSKIGRYFLQSISPPNISIRPEQTRTINFGIDFSALSNRLDMFIDLYHRKSSDLLGSKVLDSSVGFTEGRINHATVVNKGIDIQVSYPLVRHRNFSWITDLTFSYNENEVTSNNAEQRNFKYPQLVEGYPINAVWSLNFDGLDEKGLPILLDSEGERLDNGFGISLNDLPENSWIYSGQYDPKYYGSIVNTFSIHNFSVGINLLYKLGHKYRLPAAEYVTTFTSSTNAPTPGQFASDGWRNEGDELITNIPIPTDDFSAFYNAYNWAAADKNVQNASLVRLRNISLSYTLENRVLQNNYFNNMTFTVQLENPFLWTKSNLDYDPDYLERPIYTNLSSQNGYAQKRILFGVKIDF